MLWTDHTVVCLDYVQSHSQAALDEGLVQNKMEQCPSKGHKMNRILFMKERSLLIAHINGWNKEFVSFIRKP